MLTLSCAYLLRNFSDWQDDGHAPVDRDVDDDWEDDGFG